MKTNTVIKLLGIISAASLSLTNEVLAQEHTPYSSLRKIPITQLNFSNVIVTNIQLKTTEQGLEIQLEATSPVDLQPLIYSQGNDLIIDIPNTSLTLATGPNFQAQEPSQDITEVSVVALDNEGIRITVKGKTAAPQAQVVPSDQGLVLALTAAPDSQATAEDIEVVATQITLENSYFVPDASIGTGLETPLLDIPQSVQVIPEQLLQDRNVTELERALETVPGVSSTGQRGTSAFGPGILIRGFEVRESIFRDGIPYTSLAPIDTSDIERIEVLKGPASVLFGQGEPGGSINLVSKKPLADPYYAADISIGSFDSYRADIDLSGPIDTEKTVKYRLNVSYENYGSFRDFVGGERWVVSPILSWNITPQTTWNIYGQYVTNRETIDEGIVAIGTGIADVPRSRFLNEEFGNFEQDQFLLGYSLRHEFNDNLLFRHALQYLQYNPIRYSPLFDSFDEETGILNRFEYYAGGSYQRFFTNAELVGTFNTGSIKHQVLFGLEYRNNTETPEFQFSNFFAPIDIFNPIYTNTPYLIAPEFFRNDQVKRFALYLQDQVDLLPNLKLLAGFRYDYVNQFRTTQSLDEPRNEFSQTDNQISPRVGIIYQPIPTVSLYASYTTSFAPSFAARLNADDSTFDPETGEQFEVGIKADLTDTISLTFSAFDIKKQNIAVTDPNNPLFSIQTGEQTSRGIELFLSGEVLPGWNIVAGYSYLDAFVSQDTTDIVDNRLDNVPANQFSLWTTYEIQEGSLKGLGFGLGLFYVDQRQGDLDNTFFLPSYFRTDAALFYRQENWQVQLNVENLFDVEYFPSASYGSRLGVNPGGPFAVVGKISVKF
jgi:iron complex outermembrane receptor protein